MRKILILSLMLAGCATAEQSVSLPPHNYPGIVKPVVIFTHPEERIAADCAVATHAPAGTKYEARACTFLANGYCIIFMPPLTPENVHLWLAVHKHEVDGHCIDELVHGPDGAGWYTRSGERVG